MKCPLFLSLPFLLSAALMVPAAATYAGDNPDDAVPTAPAGTTQTENVPANNGQTDTSPADAANSVDVPVEPGQPELPADDSTQEVIQPVEIKKTGYRIYSTPHAVSATIFTTEGDICCDLYIDDHPLTVLNFIALAKGHPAWTDANGNPHTEPYYDGLPFEREKGKFAVSGKRKTGFVIPDERSDAHQPQKGAIAMNQPHPGAASAQFILFDRNMPELNNMFTVFGQCTNTDVIHAITVAKTASIQHVAIQDGQACPPPPQTQTSASSAKQ